MKKSQKIVSAALISLGLITISAPAEAFRNRVYSHGPSDKVKAKQQQQWARQQLKFEKKKQKERAVRARVDRQEALNPKAKGIGLMGILPNEGLSKDIRKVTKSEDIVSEVFKLLDELIFSHVGSLFMLTGGEHAHTETGSVPRQKVSEKPEDHQIQGRPSRPSLRLSMLGLYADSDF